MKSVGEFWFRIGLGAALILAGVLVANTAATLVFVALGAGNIVWTVVQANLIIRRGRRASH